MRMTDEDSTVEPEPSTGLNLPIDGVLDLHTFAPADVKDLVRDYIGECRRRGVFELRLIHGKGTGALRETVHSVLRRMPEVESFRLAQGDAGGWGATIVRLVPTDGPS